MASQQPAAADATPSPGGTTPVQMLCIGLAVASPLAMLLPPRKMDLRFMILSGVFSVSTNRLAYEYTGQSLYSRFSSRVGSAFDTSQPEGIRRTQERIREEKAARRARDEEDRRRSLGLSAAAAAAAAEGGKQNEGEESPPSPGVAGALHRTWMGGEKSGWKERRLEEERKALEEGKGYGDLIMEHIREAFGGSKPDEPK
jgi:hypothetical protein